MGGWGGSIAKGVVWHAAEFGFYLAGVGMSLACPEQGRVTDHCHGGCTEEDAQQGGRLVGQLMQ